ncbi:MAG TPA: extensin family protein [Hyphomicrobiaceae bacterium]|nr:extensin family protein [Hyphomicrobiaceae bacterium]
MKLALQGLALLSKRFSMLVIAGLAVIGLHPDGWLIDGGERARAPITGSAEPAPSSGLEAGTASERIAYVVKRQGGARKAAKAEAGAKAEAEAKAKAEEDAKLKAEAEAKSKDGMGAAAPPPGTDVQTASQAVPTPPLPEPAPPPPDVWSDAEVIDALRECVRLLGPIAAEIEVEEPLKKGACGAPAPVAVRRIGAIDKVEFRPAVPLNCRMVVALHRWIEQEVQPAARELLGSPVTRILSGSYSCRNRYGLADATISEHAFANAIDISSFTTADGRTVNVLKHWGPTQRDIEARRLAEEKAKAEAKARAAAKSPASTKAGASVLPKDPEGRTLPPLPQRAEIERELKTAQMKLGGKAPHTIPAGKARSSGEGQPKPVVPVSAAAEEEPPPPQERFLRQLHRSACGIFGTVLGPEANEAHRDHFHLDLAQRRSRRSYCR